MANTLTATSVPAMCAFYEEMTMRGHPALEECLYDGWILRFAEGYTKRSNSVSPIYPSRLELEEKVRACEAAYRERGLPVIFKMTPAAPDGLDDLLAGRGYRAVDHTRVMTVDLRDANCAGARDDILVEYALGPGWTEDYLNMSGDGEPAAGSAARRILARVGNPVICVRTQTPGAGTTACGLGVLERGHVGLFNIIVDKGHRSHGLGYGICSAILSAAKDTGAEAAHLAVVEGNAHAEAMYGKLGFKERYDYWYRVG